MSSYREELACAAGLYNGEGSCHLTRNNNSNPLRRHYPRMSLSQKYDTPSVVRFHQALGFGALTYRTSKSGGGAIVRITGFEKVQAALAMMWPWLSEIKRDQALKVLDTYHEQRGRS